MRERRRWLDTAPQFHLHSSLALHHALPELIRHLETWHALAPAHTSPATSPLEALGAIGRHLEPDFLLLQPDASSRHHLIGGCVCFPSSWSLAAKAGLALEDIHGVVPGLNASLGTSIERFLSRLTSDQAWCRFNWGLSRSAELNQDPWRQLARLASTDDPSAIWFRIEHQALVLLPASRTILFGIRVESIALPVLAAIPAARDGLLRSLQTMPGNLAAYKGLTPVLGPLCTWLGSPRPPTDSQPRPG